jgi:citrate lyase synthetase
MSKLLPQFTAIAASLLDEYIAKKRDERAAVVATAVDQVRALAEKDHLHVPPMVQKVCFTYLHSQLSFITSIEETGKLVPKQSS